MIANNGNKDNYLRGVSLDIKHYRQYFTSAEGGAWESYEIEPFDNNATVEKLRKYIDSTKTFIDYYQIVFCGHGYALDDNDTILELSPEHDCSVSVIRKMLRGKLCLLIADCCRKVYPHNTYIQDNISARLFSLRESSESAYKETCRRIFNRAIENLKNIFSSGYFAEAYSCSLGECAHEDDANGGYYTYLLLNRALADIKNKNEEVGYFSLVHDPICPKVNEMSVRDYNESQHPQRHKGGYIPFYVVPIL